MGLLKYGANDVVSADNIGEIIVSSGTVTISYKNVIVNGSTEKLLATTIAFGTSNVPADADLLASVVADVDKANGSNGVIAGTTQYNTSTGAAIVPTIELVSVTL